METKSLIEPNLLKTNYNEAEQNFRGTGSWDEIKSFLTDKTSSQAYQEYINNYHKAKSLYLITKVKKNRSQLVIYDTENGKEEIKILKTPLGSNVYACITLLPNGELFCLCRFSSQVKALIIDNNYEVRLLPSGLPIFNSSAIYFNANVYCFGGDDQSYNCTNFSRKFDLNENRWINLITMPRVDYVCHSAIFNGNILICGYSENLLLYSVSIDSFSTITYNFSYEKKILISAERLYLIEWFGSIYESEIKNEFSWNKIHESIIWYTRLNQVYCLYNKGHLYIATEIPGNSHKERYIKFDLKQKIITKF